MRRMPDGGGGSTRASASSLKVPMSSGRTSMEPRARCDRVLVVDCPEEEQIRRVMARSGLARGEVEAVMANQVSRADRLAAADDVVDNAGAPEGIGPQVAALHRKYLGLAADTTRE